MDDTAFHYSRTLRIIMILAIVVPILGIGFLLWYFTSVDVPETFQASEQGAVAEATTNSPDSHGVVIATDEENGEEDAQT